MLPLKVNTAVAPKFRTDAKQALPKRVHFDRKKSTYKMLLAS